MSNGLNRYNRPKMSCRQLTVILQNDANSAFAQRLANSLATSSHAAILVVDEKNLDGRFDESDNFPGISQGLIAAITSQQAELNLSNQEIALVGIGSTANIAAATALRFEYGLVVCLGRSLDQENVIGAWSEVRTRLLQSISRNSSNSPTRVVRIDYDEFFDMYDSSLNQLQNCTDIRYVNNSISGIETLYQWAEPAMLSYISLHSYGLNGINSRTIGKEQSRNLITVPKRCVAAIRKVSVSANQIQLRGYALIEGSAANRYGQQRVRLELASPTEKYSISVGALPDTGASLDNWREKFVDYSISGFSSYGNLGLNLDALNIGTYGLSISVESEKASLSAEKIHAEHLNVSWGSGEFFYTYISSTEGITISKKLIAANSGGSRFVNVDNFHVDENKLMVSGIFAVQGLSMADWQSGNFFLTIQGPESRTYNLAKLNHVSAREVFVGDGIDYAKAYFTTPGQNGLLLENDLLSGAYDPLLHFVHESGAHFIQPLEASLLVKRRNQFSISSNVSQATRSAIEKSFAREFVLNFEPINEPELASDALTRKSRCLFGRDGGLLATDVVSSDVFEAHIDDLLARSTDILVVDLLDTVLSILHVAGLSCEKISNLLISSAINCECDTDKLEINTDFDQSILEQEIVKFSKSFVAGSLKSDRLRIVLNRILLTKEYENNSIRVVFDPKLINLINSTLESVEDSFISYCSPLKVSAFKNGMRSICGKKLDTSPTPIDFEPIYYSRFSHQFSDVIDSQILFESEKF